MKSQTQTNQQTTHPSGPLLSVNRLVWLLFVGLSLSAFIIATPIRYRTLMSPVGVAEWRLVPGLSPSLAAAPTGRLTPQELDALGSLGLSTQFYAGYVITFEIALMLVCAVVGVIIFLRRSDDWLAWWVSLIMVSLGTNGPWLEVPTLTTIWSGGIWFVYFAGILGMVSHVHLLFLSPDGQFTPRWTSALAAGFTGGMLGLALYIMVSTERLGLLRSIGNIFLAFPVWFAMLGLGVYSQVYRYRKVSSPVERQQTKWVGVGLAAVALGFGVNAYFLFILPQQSGLPRVLSNLIRPPIVDLFMLLFPISLGFSILKYRLWDIDLIIRRTLIYGALTATLAIVYFVTVILLQRLLPTQTQLATVLSTLAVAALFSPLRRRIQNDLDRLFFRRKYDAEQTLAAFYTTVREEVDLEQLSDRLLSVVDETMQPAQVSLWLTNTDVER